MSQDTLSMLLFGAVIAVGVIGYYIGESVGKDKGFDKGYVQAKNEEAERLRVLLDPCEPKKPKADVNYPKSNVRTEHKTVGGRWL